MTYFKTTCTALALVLGLADGAAADPSDFTGFGISGTLGFGDFTSRDSSFSDGSTRARTLGVQLGYNYAFANDWIAGVQIGGAVLIDADEGAFASKNAFDIDDTEILNVRALVGKAVGSRMFLYSAVGYENWAMDFSDNDGDGTEHLDGKSLGLGMEYALEGNQSVGVEIKYSDFDQSRIHPDGVISHSINPTATQVLVNYTFRF